MKKSLLLSLFAAVLTLASCIGEEPENMECDIEEVTLLLDDPLILFYEATDATRSTHDAKRPLDYASSNIQFKARFGSTVGLIPVQLTVTPGASVYVVLTETQEDGTEVVTETPFLNGTPVDFSDEKDVVFKVVAENGCFQRLYTVRVVVEAEPHFGGELFFDMECFLLDPANKEKFYIWPIEDEDIQNTGIMGQPDNNDLYIWRNGNPGFLLSMSSARPEDYPSTPVTGDNGPSVPGNACLKLETKDTGPFGNMVKMKMAAGSFFTGQFDVANALKDALKATIFGNPFKYKPQTFEFDAKFELTGTSFQNKQGAAVPGVTDEPDAYVVFYKNHDENGNFLVLDGNDVLSSPYIVGKARLPHHYTPAGRDQESNAPIHGVTREWQHFTLPVEYTEEIDPELLANNGYSMVIGFSSSWQGAYFRGAIGTKFWVDNIRVTCEMPEEDE